MNMKFEAEMVHGYDKQNISVHDLSSIIEPRIQELMHCTARKLFNATLNSIFFGCNFYWWRFVTDD